MAKSPAIGIDLGTSFSSVGVFQNGKVKVIATIPTIVAFTDTEVLVGDDAKTQGMMEPGNTIFDIKRLIGRKFDDAPVQDDMNQLPFQTVNDGGRPKVVAEYKGEKMTFFPEEISSVVLKKLKEAAEDYLGQKVRDAVITVPAQFNDSQRRATINSGSIAGLNVLRIINEPTAAAIAYAVDSKLDKTEERNVMIFDFGGGTFDVSIVSIQNGVVQVKATAGDTHLGGQDFDNKLITHVVNEFKRKFQRDPTKCKVAQHRLRTNCERAKRTLSSSTLTSIQIDSLYDGIDLKTSITRASFEIMTYDLLIKLHKAVVQCLQIDKLNKSLINDIVLVGGSTRIPVIQKMLSAFSNKNSLNQTMNPEELVTHGAAIQAAILNGEGRGNVSKLTIKDIKSIGLGIEAENGIMTSIITRNRVIPATVLHYLSTDDLEGKTDKLLKVFEGENKQTKFNNLLSTLTLEDITPGPSGVEQLAVNFKINENGIVRISATDEATDMVIKISKQRCGLDREEIRMLREKANTGNKEKATWDALNNLQLYCYKAKENITKEAVTEAIKLVITHKCDDVAQWITENSLATIEEINAVKTELKATIKDSKANPNQCLPTTAIVAQSNVIVSRKEVKRMISCPIKGCSFKNENYIEVQQHAEKEHDEIVVPCNLCQCKMYKAARIMIHHGDAHSDVKTCPFCFKKINLHSALCSHIYLQHRNVIGMTETVDCTEIAPVGHPTLLVQMSEFCLNFALPNTRILDYKRFLINYDTANCRPLYAFECLTREELNAEKFEKTVLAIRFKEDPRLTSLQVTHESITWLMNFDHGHIAAAGNYRFSEEAWEETFVAPNCVPMLKSLNWGLWSTIESHVRKVGKTCNRVFVFTFPIYGDTPPVLSAGGVLVHIPIAFAKILYLEKTNMEITCQIFIIESEQRKTRTGWFNYMKTFDDIYNRTGFQFQKKKIKLGD